MQIARTTKARVVVGSIAATSLLLTACAGTSSTPAATSATTPAANATSASAPAASATGSAAPTSAGGSGAPASTPSGGGAKETITVGLFGNIGFQAAGLYAEYEKLHPNITIKQDNVEQAADYYKALQTHLAAGSGLDDIQAIEIGFVADIVKHHVDQFVNFNSLPEGAQLKSTFYPWKWAEASNADQSKTIGVGTDAGPEAMCYRQDLLKQAGLPNDRATLAKQWATWTDFLAFGKKYQASATRPKNSAFLDSPGSIMAPVVNQGTLAYDDASGNPDVKNSDGVKQAWALASSAAAGKLTAGLGQFSPDWNRAFSNGAFAALACPAWMLGYIQSQAGAATANLWDVAPLPGGAANWGGSWLGVPTAGKHQKEAEALAEWLTAPAQQLTMWNKQQTFPSSSTAAKDPSVASAKAAYFSNAPVGQIFSDSATKLKRVPIGPYDTQIGQAFGDALANIATKGESPDKAYKEALDNITQVTGG